MSSSIYTNSGIVHQSYNARGLILHNGVNKSLIRQTDGVLWAAVREGHNYKYINIYKSTDDGFSWTNMYSDTFSTLTRRTGITGLNTTGPVMHLVINEELNRLTLLHSFFETTTEIYKIEPFAFEITETGLTRLVPADDALSSTLITTNQDELFFDASYTKNGMFITYVSFSSISVEFYRHTALAEIDGGIKATVIEDYFSILSTIAVSDDVLHIFALRDLGANYELVHLTYDRPSGEFSANHTISNFVAADVADLNIEIDDRGTLCVLWSQENVAGTSINEYYSYSIDDGITWQAPIVIPTTTAQGDFTDIGTGRIAGRTCLLGGIGGFVISYVRKYNNEYSRAYVRLLSYNQDTDTYDLNDEKIAASNNSKDITGIRFFRPSGSILSNVLDAGKIRIAYCKGNTTTAFQVDASPAYFGQKLLEDEAYPSSDLVSWTPDTALPNQLLGNFNLLGDVGTNVDYYDEGLIGNITSKYISAFDKFATTVSFTQYEPNQNSEMSDVSAYDVAQYIYIPIFIQEINYDFPIGNNNTQTQEKYIEQDIRKIHIPPNYHLSRTFIVNNGNYLKRTVWILTYGGNQYEVSQVVPKFIDNQIAYYTANAYVVGPSRNPFSRTILPSET